MAIQSHQIVHEGSVENLALSPRSSTDQIIDAIQKRLVRPLNLVADGSTILSITSSGPYSLVDNSKLIFAPVSNSIINFSGDTFDISTGQFGSGTSYPPPATNSDKYRSLLFLINKNAQLQVVYGVEAATYQTAFEQMPPVLDGTTAIGAVIGQTDSGANWIGIRPESVVYFSSAGGSGGGSTDGGTSRNPADGYRLLMFDSFSVGETDDSSLVNDAYTNATYQVADMMYEISCDKSLSVTTTGTGFTLSDYPSFTLVVGDVIYDYASKKIRRIVSLTDNGTTIVGSLDAAFDLNLASQPCMVSQAVWSKDLVNVGDAVQKTRARDLFPSSPINAIKLDYNDSLVVSDEVADVVDTARIAVYGTSEGLQSDLTFPVSSLWGSIYKRKSLAEPILDYGMPTNSNMQRLFLCFIPNPDNIAVISSANLLDYEVSFIAEDEDVLASIRESAFCFTDSSSTPVNCSNPVVVAGKTRVTFNFSYAGNLHPNRTTGELDVILDGKLLPRYVAGSTLDGYWKEVPGTSDTIELDVDYSSYAFSLEVRRRTTESGDANYNAIRLNTFADIVVGTAKNVTDGAANYSSLQAAINAAASGNRIIILNGVSSTENVVVSKRLTIEGLGGYDSYINGTITLDANSDFSTFKNIRTTQFIFNSGATGNVVQNCFWSTDPIDNGSANLITGINIT